MLVIHRGQRVNQGCKDFELIDLLSACMHLNTK